MQHEMPLRASSAVRNRVESRIHVELMTCVSLDSRSSRVIRVIQRDSLQQLAS